jgi:hypothetical protein
MSVISLPPLSLNIIAAVLTMALGIVYLIRTGAIRKDFKIILKGLQKVLTMTLVWQGLTLVFIGLLVLVLALSGQREHIAKSVSYMCGAMLLVLGVVTGATGGQSEYILFRIGQFAQVVAAILIFAGNIPQ